MRQRPVNLDLHDMYQYVPPKSNTWGHALRNMEPTRQKELFEQFLKRAVAEYSFRVAVFSVLTVPSASSPENEEPSGDSKADRVQRFERLLGAKSYNGCFPSITLQQCEIAYKEIVENPSIRPGLILLQDFGISKWLIDGQPAETQSSIGMYYGMQPRIKTFLEFETMVQFQFVKQVLSDLKFCTLNEKHLKPVKRGKKRT